VLAKLRAFLAIAQVLVCSALVLVGVAPHAAVAQGRGAIPLIGGGDKTPPVVTITPSVDTTVIGTVSVTIDWCDNVSLIANSRSITLNGQSVTSNFTYTTSTKIGCGAHATSTGTVTLTLGANTLFAGISDQALNGGSSSAQYVFQHFLTVNTTAMNEDNQDYSICAQMCFAATFKASTVPYRTLDAGRDVNLAYQGDRIAVRPQIYADAFIAPGGFALQKYELQAKVRWGGGAFVAVTFTNSENALYFAPTVQSDSVRLIGQVDASSEATNVYPLQIIVTAIYTNGQSETVVDSSQYLMVVNERNSPIARGWALVGIPRLYYPLVAPGAMIVEGDGTARYYRADRCLPGGKCPYTSPTGDYSALTRDSATNQFTRAFPDSTHQYFSSSGALTSAVDQFGNATGYVYDGSSRLTEILDPYRIYHNGTTCVSGCPTYISLSYGANGIASITEPGASGQPGSGRNTSLTVGSDSTLRSITDPDGKSTNFGYDASRRMSTIVSRRGDTTRLVYAADSSWKLAQVVKPRVPIDNGSGGTTLQSPTETLTGWQAAGLPLGLTASTPATPIRTATVSASTVDAGGHKTTYYVDRWGQPLKVVEPYGRTTTIERNGVFAVKVTHPNGSVDTSAYNSSGLLVYSQKAGVAYPTFYAYGAFGRPTSISTPHSGIGTSASYTSHGGDSIVSVHGQTTKYFIDSRGRDTLIVDEVGHRTRYQYDNAFGNRDTTEFQTSILQGWSIMGTKVFDAHGRDSIAMALSAPTDTITYDSINRPLRIATAGWKKTYVYDPLYRTHVRDNQNHDFADSTNALGWLVSHTALSGTPVAFRYNLDGLPTSFTNGRGQLISLQYDSLHRVVKRFGASFAADSFAYDVIGLKQVATNAVSTDSMFSSPSGWTDSIVTHIHGLRFRRYYKPTALLQLDSMSIVGPSTIPFLARKIYWDTTTGQIDSVSINHHTTKLTYDAAGSLSEVAYPTTPNAVTLGLTYVGPSNIGTRAYSFVGFDRAYGYDFDFRLTEEDRDAEGGPQVIRTFAYDTVGELLVAALDSNSGTHCSTEDSTYGRMCAHVVPPSALSRFTYDSVGNLVSELDSSAAGGTTVTGRYVNDRDTAWNGASFTYDNDGDRLTSVRGSDTTSYAWNGFGQLDTVTRGGTKVGYSYNALGQVVAKSINGAVNRYFLWDGNQLLAELDSSGTHRIGEYVYETSSSNNPLAMVVGADTGNVRYLASDGLGNVIGSFRGSNSVVSSYDYDVYGLPVSAPSDSNRVRWKGLFWEGDSTDLYFAHARWYDPATRRFLSEDPSGVSGGLNPYLYSGNNPIMGSDPFGLFAPSACYYDWISCSASDVDNLSWFDGEGSDDAYVCDINVLGADECLEQAAEIFEGLMDPGLGWQQVSLAPFTPQGKVTACGAGIGVFVGPVDGVPPIGAGASVGIWVTPDGTWGFYNSTMKGAGFGDEGANVGPEISFTNEVDADGGSDVGTCFGLLVMVCASHSLHNKASVTFTVTEGTGVFNFSSSTNYHKIGSGMGENQFDAICGLIFGWTTP